MIKKILYITLFSLLTFTFNVNSAEIKCDSVVISSPDIKGDEDCKKKKISTKNAEVKFDDGSIYQGPIKKNNKLHNKYISILDNNNRILTEDKRHLRLDKLALTDLLNYCKF